MNMSKEIAVDTPQKPSFFQPSINTKSNKRVPCSPPLNFSDSFMVKYWNREKKLRKAKIVRMNFALVRLWFDILISVVFRFVSQSECRHYTKESRMESKKVAARNADQSIAIGELVAILRFWWNSFLFSVVLAIFVSLSLSLSVSLCLSFSPSRSLSVSLSMCLAPSLSSSHCVYPSRSLSPSLSSTFAALAPSL